VACCDLWGTDVGTLRGVGWDGLSIALIDTDSGRRRARVDRVRELAHRLYGEDTVEAFHYSPRTGYMLLALRDGSGGVLPAAALVECADDPKGWNFLVGDDPAVIMVKDVSVDESPQRWPTTVADRITRWD
jgi:hypothetical protein